MTTKKPRKRHVADTMYIESSGNVFADLGVPNPEEAMAKAKVALKSVKLSKKRNLLSRKRQKSSKSASQKFLFFFAAI